MLERFLPRFNTRFRVPAAEPAVAYRPLDPALPPRLHPRLPAPPQRRARQHREVPLAHAPAAARARADQLRRGAGRGGGTAGRRALRPASGGDDPLARGTAARRGAEGGALRAGPEPRPRAHRLRARLRRSTPAAPRAPLLPLPQSRWRATVLPADPRPGASSSALPHPGSSPAGRRSSRRGYRDSRCGQPPGCSGSPATPSAATSGPTACLDARTAPRHPPTEAAGLTKSLLSCTDKIAARRHSQHGHELRPREQRPWRRGSRAATASATPAPTATAPAATGSGACQSSSTSSASASAATCCACAKTDSTESASSSPETIPARERQHKPGSTEEERMSGCGWVLRCSWDNGFVRITYQRQGAPIRCYQRATPTG